jgi:hypothetical protein
MRRVRRRKMCEEKGRNGKMNGKLKLKVLSSEN